VFLATADPAGWQLLEAGALDIDPFAMPTVVTTNDLVEKAAIAARSRARSIASRRSSAACTAEAASASCVLDYYRSLSLASTKFESEPL
jgi:hypothetical protein